MTNEAMAIRGQDRGYRGSGFGMRTSAILTPSISTGKEVRSALGSTMNCAIGTTERHGPLTDHLTDRLALGPRSRSMKCPQCGQDNPPQAKFCQECATALSRRFSKCGAQLSPTAKFCVECATPVAAADARPSPASYMPKHLAERILTSKAALARR